MCCRLLLQLEVCGGGGGGEPSCDLELGPAGLCVRARRAPLGMRSSELSSALAGRRRRRRLLTSARQSIWAPARPESSAKAAQNGQARSTRCSILRLLVVTICWPCCLARSPSIAIDCGARKELAGADFSRPTCRPAGAESLAGATCCRHSHQDVTVARGANQLSHRPTCNQIRSIRAAVAGAGAAAHKSGRPAGSICHRDS